MLLGGGMSSRLFQRVREELGLAYSVYHVSARRTPDTGHHGVYLASAPGSAQKALDAVREILADVAIKGCPRPSLPRGASSLRDSW